MSNNILDEFLAFGFFMIENTAYYKMFLMNPTLTLKQKKEVEKNYTIYCEKLTQFLSELLLKEKCLPELRNEAYTIESEIKKKVDEWLPTYMKELKKNPVKKGDYYT